jgi:hypothetical protein
VLLLVGGISAKGQQEGAAVLKRLRYPADARLLILHADDVGMSHSANMASFEALQKGYVTSASIMVPCPWFSEAAEFARAHPEYDFGLHLTLTSEWQVYRWRPVRLEGVESLVDAMGYFPRESGSVRRNAKPDEAEAEVTAQLARASEAGIVFSHLDNHMGAMSQSAALFAVYLKAGQKARVPVLISPSEAKAYAAVVAEFGRNLPAPEPLGPREGVNAVDWFRQRFATLPPGLYYTVVHLGQDDEELRAIMREDAGGARARAADLQTVSDPAFREALERYHIQLVSWKEIARRMTLVSDEEKQETGRVTR